MLFLGHPVLCFLYISRVSKRRMIQLILSQFVGGIYEDDLDAFSF